MSRGDREQSDEILGFLHQLAKSPFRSTLGEFIQMGVLSTSWHVVSQVSDCSGSDMEPCSFVCTDE
jgi:hypothetical protein